MENRIILTVFLFLKRFEALKVNYLTIPVYLTACFILAGVTYISDKIRKRAVVAIIVPFIVIVGYAIPIGTPVASAGFFAMFLCSGGKDPNPWGMIDLLEGGSILFRLANDNFSLCIQHYSRHMGFK